MENDPLDLFSVTCFAQFLPDIGKSLLLSPSAHFLKEKKNETSLLFTHRLILLQYNLQRFFTARCTLETKTTF